MDCKCNEIIKKYCSFFYFIFFKVLIGCFNYMFIKL